MINHNPDLMPSTARPFRPTLRQFIILLILAAGFGNQPVHAATRIWTGGHASSANWNLRANWDGAAVPVNGDTVVFPSGAARMVNTNNITGLRLHEIQFLGLGGGYNLRGASLAVSNGVTVAAAALNTLSVASVTLYGSQDLSVASGGQLVVNSDLVLSNGNLTLSAAGDMSLRGGISGNGDVIKNGNGSVTYFSERNNTYTGRTVVNAGTLALNQRETISVVPLTIVSRIAVPGNLIVGNGTNPAIARLNYDDQIANTATVTIREGSELRFFGNRDALADVVLQGGAITMDGGSLVLNGNITSLPSPTLATVGGQIILNNNATFNVGDGPAGTDLEISARIGDNGGQGFTKSGAGTMRLGGTNVYGGTTMISSGVVRAANDRAFGSANNGTTIATGAELLIETAVNTLREPLTIAGSGVGGTSGAIRIGSGATIATNIVLSAPATIHTLLGGNLVIEGVISGTGPLMKIGPGTLELAGKSPNTYSGSMLAKDGLLLLSKLLGASVPGDLIIGTTNTAAIVRHTRGANVSGAVTVNAESLYDLDGHNESIDALTLNGGGDVDSGTGQLTLDGDVVVNVQPRPVLATSRIRGRLHVGNGERHFMVERESDGALDLNELIIEAHVAGSANLVKSGPGDLILTSSNSFTGDLIVEDGELYFTHAQGLGSTSGRTIVTGNASLIVFGSYEDEPDGTGIVVDEPLFLNTTGQANGSAVYSFGSNVLSGPIFLAQNTSFRVYTNHTLHLAGTINGLAGLIKTGPGMLVYSGTRSNTYIGATIVNEGTLRLKRSGAGDPSIPGALIIGDGEGIDVVELDSAFGQIHDNSPVTIHRSGYLVNHVTGYEHIGSLAGSGGVLFFDGAGLKVGENNASTLFSGIIAGDGELEKTGTGTLTLTGTNTYVGTTSIGGGTLVVNGAQTASDIYVATDGTLRGTGRVGDVTVEGTLAPGDPKGELIVENLDFLPGGRFKVDLDGIGHLLGHGLIEVRGAANLAGAVLDVSLGFAPKTGDYFFLCTSGHGDDLTGNFVGLPEGAVIYRNHIPLVVSYLGNTCCGTDDLMLTVGDLPLRLDSTRVEGGNGNGLIDANECDNLYVAIANPTAAPVSVVSAHLQSMDNQIAITSGEGVYGIVPAMGMSTNRLAFQIHTAAGYECGKNARFKLVVDTLAHGKFSVPIDLTTGKRSNPITFQATDLPASIPDNSAAWVSSIAITNEFRVAKVRVSVFALHPSVGQLRFYLGGPPDYSTSPVSTWAKLFDRRGGAGNNLGSNCLLRTTFDDDAPGDLAVASAPFAGWFKPEESLSTLIGVPAKGNWSLYVVDDAVGALGSVLCWSLELFPAECDSDGGGGCSSCLASVNGVIDQSSPTLPHRLSRFNPPSGCGDNPPCAGAISGPGSRYRYGTHTFTNSGPDACVTAVISTPCTDNPFYNVLVGSAYLGDFNSENLCANLAGFSRDDVYEGSAGFGAFSFRVPAGERFTVVVNEQNLHQPFEGCGSYTLDLYGLPCPQAQPTLKIANDAGPGNVRLHWSTAYPGFDLQGKPNLGGNGVLSVFTNVNATPVVVDGDYSVTNKHDGQGKGFFRLRKP